ncbi:MAG: PmeII family type II restriction endonuclease, partial [Bacteroidales bacterium]
MNPLKLTDVRQYVEENIGIFHEKRIARLEKLKLKTVLKK